jgi:hypothetical protein
LKKKRKIHTYYHILFLKNFLCNNSDKILLKYVGIQNIFNNTNIYRKKLIDIDINNSFKDNVDIIEHKISFNKKIFTFNNYFFSMTKIDISDKEDIINKIIESLSDLFNLEIPLLPITYQVIYQNIINLLMDENYYCQIDVNENL